MGYTEGVSADGEFSSSATVTVFDCQRGRLEARLVGKSASRVSLKLNRRVQRVVPLRDGALWRGSVEARPQAGGIWVFELDADGLVGVRRLSFIRR